MESIDSTGLSLPSLVCFLIREDLKCNKLVLGLSELGLDAGKYHLDICTLVFNLIGFREHDDKLLELYMDFMDRVLSVPDVEDQGILDTMAKELYDILLTEKETRTSN